MAPWVVFDGRMNRILNGVGGLVASVIRKMAWYVTFGSAMAGCFFPFPSLMAVAVDATSRSYARDAYAPGYCANGTD